MEADKAAMHESSSDEGGIADDMLFAACKKVKGKITIIKQRSNMKKRLSAKSRIRTLDEMADGLKEKGINVNEESMATRVQNRRTIGDLEDSAHLRAKDVLGLSDSSDDEEDVDDDEVLKIEEGEKRGRKGRDDEKKGRKLLGKRRRDSSD
jgi:hypothetical protein